MQKEKIKVTINGPKKSGGLVDGWMDGWVDGWVVEFKAVLRIAYSN